MESWTRSNNTPMCKGKGSIDKLWSSCFYPKQDRYGLWVRGYCILALTLNSNCEFTLISAPFVILPYLSKLKTGFALLCEQHVTVSNELEKDKFVLANIPLILWEYSDFTSVPHQIFWTIPIDPKENLPANTILLEYGLWLIVKILAAS